MSSVFAPLNLHPVLEEALASEPEFSNFTSLSVIQKLALPRLLAGKDVAGQAPTGSGKSLAFLLPALHKLLGTKGKPVKSSSTASALVLVLTPTRELALQLFSTTQKLLKKSPSITPVLLMGGNPRAGEASKLCSSTGKFIIATPGRLLDHVRQGSLSLSKVKMLILDEADRLLDAGFSREVQQVLELVPSSETRQTALFSATQTSALQELKKLALHEPEFIETMQQGATVPGTADSAGSNTLSNLNQGYVMTPLADRFMYLYTFLRKHRSKKTIVFFSSCASAQHHADLLNYIDVPCLVLHGKQKQQKRTGTFFEFKNAEKGTLLCTDVAARGLDIPAVDWIVQYDPPGEATEYIHRVGRTARAGRQGRGLLFLMPDETAFLQHLMRAGAKLTQFEFASSKVAKLHDELEELVNSNFHLHQSAREAFRSYLLAYASHGLKDAFDVRKIDLNALARSLGFAQPPKVSLPDIGVSAGKRKRKELARALQQKEQRHKDRLSKKQEEEAEAEAEAAEGQHAEHEDAYPAARDERPVKKSKQRVHEEEDEEPEAVQERAPKKSKKKKAKKDKKRR